ncbi:hypothetical protein Patl1_33862 [Pistacia atlantica]|uniref:Uncharacterized protein n=1 Tax=Pistacia atlantica TaxID=434234 RepID=A0ACC0ZT21_9ROSI|nr:hypothetical protein Patl1_33862 [Pistacia atlantica]
MNPPTLSLIMGSSKPHVAAPGFPDLCFSALANVPEAAQKVTSQKDVIELSLNLTTTTVEHNYFTVEKLLATRKKLTKREKTALHDCLETIDETLDELRKAKEDLPRIP